MAEIAHIKEERRPNINEALATLVLVAGFHRRVVDPKQLSLSMGFNAGSYLDPSDVVRAAVHTGLKARIARASVSRLERLRVPAIACLAGGRFAVVLPVGGAATDTSPVMYPDGAPPRQKVRADLADECEGGLILIKLPLISEDSHHPFGLIWFVPTLWKYRQALKYALLAALLTQLFAIAGPLFIQVIFDKVLTHHSITTLNVLVLGMFIATVFEGAMATIRAHILAHSGTRIDALLGSKVLRHLLSLPLRYFDARRIGDTVARVRELESIRRFMTGSPVTLLSELPFVVLFVVVLLLYSVKLTLVTLAFVVLFLALPIAVSPIIRTRLAKKFDLGAETQSYLTEVVAGIHTVKAMALEPFVYSRWDEQLARYVTVSYRLANMAGIVSALGKVVEELSGLAILWVGVYLVMSGSLTVGQLIAFRMLAGRVTSPALHLVQLWQDLQQFNISLKRLADLLDARSEPMFGGNAAAMPQMKGEVRMEQVTFRYGNTGRPALSELTWSTAAGSVVGVVGRSGSGKSTLSRLLQGLYLPETGRVLIDGIDIRHMSSVWLRRQTGIVLQDNFLFNGTLRENIAIQLPNATMDQIIEAAKLAGAHEFIAALPLTYDTPVGERGIALSGGQRQRIAIARAIIANPRILILDEATSSLDYESERHIYENLGRIAAGRTVFVIAHRLSTVRRADLILVLEQGSLVEHGTHEELLARGGTYCHLLGQQML